jgi:hypothetical protein
VEVLLIGAVGAQPDRSGGKEDPWWLPDREIDGEVLATDRYEFISAEYVCGGDRHRHYFGASS